MLALSAKQVYQLLKLIKFNAHVASVCRKVGGKVNALNRLQIKHSSVQSQGIIVSSICFASFLFLLLQSDMVSLRFEKHKENRKSK